MSNKSRVRALSIKKPFAEAILRGIKTYEERDRPVNIRGSVYIYASKTPPVGVQKLYAERYYDELNAKPGEFPAGVLVGTVEITGYDGSPGKFRWHLKAPERLPEPIQPEARSPQVWFFPFKDK